MPSLGGLVSTESRRAGLAYTFTHTLAAGATEGTYTFQVALIDEAGNIGVRALSFVIRSDLVVDHHAARGPEYAATFTFLGTTLADAQGGFPSFWLEHAEDHPEAFVVVLDAAGNASASTSGGAGTASRIRNGAWTELRGKVPGSRAENPHEVTRLTRVEPTLEQDAEFARPHRHDGRPCGSSDFRGHLAMGWTHV